MIKKKAMGHEQAAYKIAGTVKKGSALQPYAVFLAGTLALFLVMVQPVQAQDKTAAIDKLFSWATPTTPGCVCAVSQQGKVVANQAYGLADLEQNIPMSPASVFDIGSTRKQFIAAAVLLLVEEKRLALTDDIRKYIPQLPKYGSTITVDQLLTHTSGIRDWTGMLSLASGDPEVLKLILRQRGLNFKPGEEWSYSNSGYVLLTEIVARISKMPFADFVRQRLFEPLGMRSTTYLVNMTDVVKERALGYEKDKDQWKLDMYLGNNRGGGAIFSTAADLLIWNEALAKKRLGTFVTEKLQEPAQLNNGRQLSYARGLFLDTYRGVKEVAHSGGAAGYHSWLGRYPEQDISIAVLCNSDAMAATALAHRVADLYVTPSTTTAAETGPPPTLTGDTLQQATNHTGLFFTEATGQSLRIALDRNRMRIAGGPGLVPVATNRYRRWGNALQFMSMDAFELQFLSNDQFVLHSKEGKTTTYRRARPYTPSPEDLRAFAGRYQSDEIGGYFDIVVGKEGLMGRVNDTTGAGLPLSPVDPDTFQIAGVTIRFVRNKAGKVVALQYSNPLVRNIPYTRLASSNP
jgi:CubicO group peptidase (beta-lactamase class C family)